MLDFDKMRKANRERTEGSFHPVDTWSPSDWATAVVGELGEACNLIKKLRRGQSILISDVAEELADTVLYLDLLSDSLGIDLASAIVYKFNKTSLRIGSEVFLPFD